jgi:predicted DNA binding protein
MRQVVIEIEPNEAARRAQRPMFAHIHSYEVLEVLKMDHVEGLYVDLIECRTREGVSIYELDRIGDMEVLSVISSVGDRHTVLVKGHETAATRSMFDDAGLDLVYTAPSLISEDRIVVSLIGTQRNLTSFVGLVREHVGRITNMTFKRATYRRRDILSVLTEKQRAVMVAAHRHGYYDIPRRTSSARLSEKLGISRPTLLEHLRKAEGRLLAEMMAGHPV